MDEQVTIGTAHDDPEQSVHDDPDIDFWAVLHYDPDRPDTNIFGNAPYSTRDEALARVAEIEASRLEALAYGEANPDEPGPRCRHRALVIPIFASAEMQAIRAIREAVLSALVGGKPPEPVH